MRTGFTGKTFIDQTHLYRYVRRRKIAGGLKVNSFHKNKIKKSMSRKTPAGGGTLPDSWFTATTQLNWDAGATELGTPKAANGG